LKYYVEIFQVFSAYWQLIRVRELKEHTHHLNDVQKYENLFYFQQQIFCLFFGYHEKLAHKESLFYLNLTLIHVEFYLAFLLNYHYRKYHYEDSLLPRFFLHTEKLNEMLL